MARDKHGPSEGEESTASAKAYIFDFDGTLGTIPVDWEGVRQAMKKITGSPLEFRPVFPTISYVLAERPEKREAVLAAIDGYEAAGAPSAKLFDGAKELLEVLSKRADLSLVTMQGARACTTILEEFGLQDFFKCRFTREDSLDRASQLEMALLSMGSDKSQSVFVADRLNDLNAAIKVGLRFVMIRTHGEDPEEDVPVYHSLAEFLKDVS